MALASSKRSSEAKKHAVEEEKNQVALEAFKKRIINLDWFDKQLGA